MAEALIRGLLRADAVKPDNIYVADKDAEKAAMLREALQVNVADNNADLAISCQCIFLAVKPVFMGDVIGEIKGLVKGKCVVSIAAGWSFSMLKSAFAPFSDAMGLLRIMPNTSVSVGQGTVIICEEHSLTDDMFLRATSLFSGLGYTCTLPERLLNAATAASGSSPAFAYVFMEAMADGAVRLGLPRDVATRLAAQTLMGAGKMVMTGKGSPAALKDAVSSPGGSTIEGIYALETGAFRGTVMNAMDACAKRLFAMEQESKSKGE